MTKGHAPLGQVVRRQLNGHPVTRQDPDVVLAHLTGEVGQHLVPLGYLHFKGGVSHALDYSSINRNHVFFWNDVTSFHRVARVANPGHIVFILRANDSPLTIARRWPADKRNYLARCAIRPEGAR